MKKDDLPAMPFYVGDWLKAPDIQCLAYDLKGLWFEMLCYMWESPERGVLLYSSEELSRLLRLPEDLLKQKLKQMESKNIFSIRESDGAIFCRRMVRDQEIREIRTKSGSIGGRRSFASRFAQAKTQAKCENENVIENESAVVTETKKQQIKPSFDFEAIWKKYPSNGRVGKKKALTHFVASVLNEQDYSDIKKALDNYIVCKRVKEGFIQNATTWFNNWRDWIEYRERKPIDDIPESIRKYFNEDGSPIK